MTEDYCDKEQMSSIKSSTEFIKEKIAYNLYQMLNLHISIFFLLNIFNSYNAKICVFILKSHAL